MVHPCGPGSGTGNTLPIHTPANIAVDKPKVHFYYAAASLFYKRLSSSGSVACCLRHLAGEINTGFRKHFYQFLFPVTFKAFLPNSSAEYYFAMGSKNTPKRSLNPKFSAMHFFLRYSSVIVNSLARSIPIYLATTLQPSIKKSSEIISSVAAFSASLAC
jgi:hypothetical protein